MTDVDDSLIEWLTGGAMSEDFEYNMKKKSLEKDQRIVKDSFVDINAAYKDYMQYSSTNEFKNAQRAREIMNTDFANVSDLKNILQSSYRLTKEDVNSVLKHLGNSHDIEIYTNPYTKAISMRRIK